MPSLAKRLGEFNLSVNNCWKNLNDRGAFRSHAMGRTIEDDMLVVKHAP
jgi:hypothetical protein